MSTTATPPKSPTAVERALAALVELLSHADADVRADAAKAILDARRDGIA